MNYNYKPKILTDISCLDIVVICKMMNLFMNMVITHEDNSRTLYSILCEDNPILVGTASITVGIG